MALFIKIFVIDTSQPPKGEAFPVKLEVLLPLCGWPLFLVINISVIDRGQTQKGAAFPVQLEMLLPLWLDVCLWIFYTYIYP